MKSIYIVVETLELGYLKIEIFNQ